jgi:hypothetical protein
MGLVYPVGIDQEKRGKNSVMLLYHWASGIREKFSVNTVVFIPTVPAILNPGPGFIIDIHKILIVKMNLGEITPYHAPSFYNLAEDYSMLWLRVKPR